MSDNDLIRRWDAMAAVRTSDFRWEAEDAIAVMPAVAVVPIADLLKVKTELRQAQERLAALEPVVAPTAKVPEELIQGLREMQAYPDPMLRKRIQAVIAALEPVAAPRRYMGQIMAECDCSRQSECEAAQRCLAEPEPDPAAIREAALREALKALDSLPEYGSPDVNIGVSNAYSAIIALIQKGAADDR